MILGALLILISEALFFMKQGVAFVASLLSDCLSARQASNTWGLGFFEIY